MSTNSMYIIYLIGRRAFVGHHDQSVFGIVTALTAKTRTNHLLTLRVSFRLCEEAIRTSRRAVQDHDTPQGFGKRTYARYTQNTYTIDPVASVAWQHESLRYVIKQLPAY